VRTSEISAALRTGRHTTTGTTLYFLTAEPEGGWLVDSPGMTAFALAHLEPETIERSFVDVRPFLGQCRFRDCRHASEPGCAVQDAVARGAIAPHRVALLHALVGDSERARDPARR
jgi:ribosome biogenesis GTPase